MTPLPLLLALASGSAAGDYLAEAHKAVDNLEYERAASRLTQARNAPDLDLPTRLDLLELTGVVAASLDQPEQATAAFRELLALDPDFHARTDWSPKVRAPFHEAVGWVEENGHLEIHPLTPNATDTAVHDVGVAIDKDPLHLAHAVRLHVLKPKKKEATLEAKAPDLVRLAIDEPAPEVSWWAELLDAGLRPLALVGSAKEPVVTRIAAATPAPAAGLAATAPESAEPEYRPLAYGLGIAGVVSAGVGTAFGIISNSDRSQIQSPTGVSNGIVTSLTQRKADSLAAEGKTDAYLADGLWIAGGVLVAAGVAVYFWGEPATITPTGNGVAVTGALP